VFFRALVSAGAEQVSLEGLGTTSGPAQLNEAPEMLLDASQQILRTGQILVTEIDPWSEGKSVLPAAPAIKQQLTGLLRSSPDASLRAGRAQP
jgi:hypothetical protein